MTTPASGGQYCPIFSLTRQNFIPLLYRVSDIFLTPFETSLKFPVESLIWSIFNLLTLAAASGGRTRAGLLWKIRLGFRCLLGEKLFFRWSDSSPYDEKAQKQDK